MAAWVYGETLNNTSQSEEECEQPLLMYIKVTLPQESRHSFFSPLLWVIQKDYSGVLIERPLVVELHDLSRYINL